MNKELLRQLIRVDELVEISRIKLESTHEEEDCTESVSLSLLTESARLCIDEVRRAIIDGRMNALPTKDAYIDKTIEIYTTSSQNHLRKVINATGITLHTNLGRALLAKEAAYAAYNAAVNYTNLEYDIEKGVRGTRYSHVEELICSLVGAEAALVVNNNAAAVMLALHAVSGGKSKNKNMLISRGELVEIGGSFRIPAVMEISGVSLNEVGTTNRTRLKDYEDSIDENTCAILKVHNSNFVIEGFTESTSLEELAALAKSSGIPLIFDMGSGELDRLHSCADIICFSGDKLLGGPQAGIIAGKSEYIEKVKNDQLLRTLRVDKMTIAALEATLKLLVEKRMEAIPTLAMLDADICELNEKAQRFKEMVEKTAGDKVRAVVIQTTTEAGGGTMPCVEYDDVCVSIEIEGCDVDEISRRLRTNGCTPIVGRISDDKYLMSVRTMTVADMTEAALIIGEEFA